MSLFSPHPGRGMNDDIDKAGALRGLMARLEMDAGLGVDFLSATSDIVPLLRALDEPAAVPAPRPVPPSAPPPSRSGDVPSGRFPSAAAAPRDFSLVPPVDQPVNQDKEELLSGLRDACLACRDCGLCERRTTVVWGEGSLDAPVMFIGEGPGRDEDAAGRPFVGRSGRLLTDIIEKGMKMPRGGVYIANVVKCRPPGNRDPKPEEVAACSRYLERQIEVVSPRVIVAVGNVAGRALLGLEEGAGGLRGRWWERGGLPLRVIYHPSYLLRQRRDEGDRTQADRATWEDVQEVMRKL